MEPLVNTIVAILSSSDSAETATPEDMNADMDEEIREIYEEYSRQLEIRLREFSGSEFR